MSRQGGVVLVLILALAGGAMTARTLGAAGRRAPVDLLRNPTSPGCVVLGLLRGSPAQPGWQEAAVEFAGRGDLRVFLLLALSGEGELEPVIRSWLAGLAARADSGTASRRASLDRLLATFALERPGDAGPR